jgi:RNAse (barnase) inhibitor barstar
MNLSLAPATASNIQECLLKAYEELGRPNLDTFWDIIKNEFKRSLEKDRIER